jgi:hypothetical protein
MCFDAIQCQTAGRCCFVALGSECIDLMLKQFSLTNRGDGIDIGQKLLCADMVRPNPNMHGKVVDHLFKDDGSWYYFGVCALSVSLSLSVY